MARPRTFADSSPAARMRRSRQALRARGGRLVQVKLDPDACRAVAALEFANSGAKLSELLSTALVGLAAQHRFPVRLSREQEMQLARLAIGPFTVAQFRKTGHGDDFLAGIAMALATDHDLPRAKLLGIARELASGVVNADGYRRWLDASPIRLARLFKLADAERGIARAQSAA